MRARSWFVIFTLLQWLLVVPSLAGEFEDGLAAWNKGDYPAALVIFKPLAEREHRAAEHQLAVMYASGQGVAQSDSEAIKWYRRAAGHGYPPAQLAIAISYEQGRGLPKSHSKAMKWYRLAAQQGDVTARVTLGLIYSEGRGVPRNPWQAAKYFGLAAEQGDVTAQYNLGLLYAEGQGVSQDTMQAYEWFSIAAANGDAAAAESRDRLSRQLTAKQVTQALKRVDQWAAAKAADRAVRCQMSQAADCN